MLDQPADMLVEAAARAGFDGVGLRLTGEHALADVERFRAHVADRGLIVHDTEVHRIAADAPDPGALIEATAAVGADRLLVVSDLPDRAATLTALDELTDRCQARGIRIGLEYMAWTDPSRPIDAIEVAAATGCELLVDVLHHHRVGAGVDELEAIVASGTLGWVQLCDAPLAHPGGPGHTALLYEARHGRLPPGHGELPLTHLLARLPADVTISVEVQSDGLLSMPPFDRARVLHDASRRTLAG